MVELANPTSRGFWLVLGLLVVLAAGSSWVLYQLLDIRHASPPDPVPALQGTAAVAAPAGEVVRIGVVSRFAPNIIYRLYQPIIDYLNEGGSYRYELALSDSYRDAAERLRSGDVQASFLGAWMCYELPPDSPLEPVLVPVNADGGSRFHAVLVTANDSPVQSMADLVGRRVAVPSDQAFSGNWLQDGGLDAVGLRVADLDTIRHFKYHETVVWTVLRKEFDAGVVKQSLAHRYRVHGLRTIAVSPAFPGPPLVATRRSGEAVREIVRLLLDLDRDDAADRTRMQSWTPEFAFGFTAVDWESFRAGFERPLADDREER